MHTLRSSGGRPESAKPLRCPPIFRPTWKVATGYPIGSWATSLALPRRFEAIPRFERRAISGSCVSVPGSGACVFVGQRNQSIRVALHGGMAAREEESGASRSCWTGPFGSPQRHWTSHGLTGPFRKRKKKNPKSPAAHEPLPRALVPSIQRHRSFRGLVCPTGMVQAGAPKRDRGGGRGVGGVPGSASRCVSSSAIMAKNCTAPSSLCLFQFPVAGRGRRRHVRMCRTLTPPHGAMETD